jgi:cytoskeletal protein CcmA (bactofilin family)
MIGVCLLWILLFILPFLPAWLELKKKRDAKPLPIDLHNIQDPAYWGQNFRKLARKLAVNKNTNSIFDEAAEQEENAYERLLSLSKDKTDEEKNISSRGELAVILSAKEAIARQKEFTFGKEVWVGESLTIVMPCRVKSLLVEGDFGVKAPFDVAQRLHIEGSARLNCSANLGTSAYVAQELILEAPCQFYRLFAKAIITPGDCAFIDSASFAEPSRYEKQTLKSEETLRLGGREKSIIIEGNLIAEKDIILEGKVWVKGHIFAQGSIFISGGCVIGVAGKTKSVVAQGRITLGKGVKIYGYLHSYEQGSIEV